MDLYKNSDVDVIKNNIGSIVDETLKIRNSKIQLTMEKYKEVIEVIKTFIKKKKRIIYGGYGFNELIKAKNKDDAIYNDLQMPDIEFYTPEPLQDLVELCNKLHDNDFCWVSGQQAQHNSTYKIFVEFENVCDFTYMPTNVYRNMPVTKLDGILYSSPIWIAVDILRHHNDIMSFERLRDKIFQREVALFNNYKFVFDTKEKLEFPTTNNNLKEELFNRLVSRESLCFVGSVASHYYSNLSSTIDVTNIEVISSSFKKDVKEILYIIEDILGDKFKDINIKAFRPFFQFWDERVIFKLNDEHLLTIYGNNEMCIPYNNLYIDKNKIKKIQTNAVLKDENNEGTVIKIGTFIVVFNHYLIHRHYQYIFRSDDYKKYEGELHKLLKKRNKYLNENNLHVLDNSPYREFIIRCTGELIDVRRKYRLDMSSKKAKKKLMTFRYDPSTQKDNFTVPDYSFPNTSGKESESLKSKLIG